jgi:uncharacterized protein (DUF1810 family)
MMNSMDSHEPAAAGDDTFHLSRFLSAQEDTFAVALSELRRGRKCTHWMWYIFPQLAGLGSSPTAEHYAIRSLEETRAYLNHPVLGPRLLDCCRALLAVQGRSAPDIMGYPDDLKLRSSMTLFSLVEGAPSEFRAVLQKYYQGQSDGRTIELLKRPE